MKVKHPLELSETSIGALLGFSGSSLWELKTWTFTYMQTSKYTNAQDTLENTTCRVTIDPLVYRKVYKAQGNVYTYMYTKLTVYLNVWQA